MALAGPRTVDRGRLARAGRHGPGRPQRSSGPQRPAEHACERPPERPPERRRQAAVRRRGRAERPASRCATTSARCASTRRWRRRSASALPGAGTATGTRVRRLRARARGPRSRDARRSDRGVLAGPGRPRPRGAGEAAMRRGGETAPWRSCLGCRIVTRRAARCCKACTSRCGLASSTSTARR